MQASAIEPAHNVLDFQAYVRRRRFELEIGECVPALTADLHVLRHSRDQGEIALALERVVALGPPALDLEPLLQDAAAMMVAHYAATLGPWSRTVTLPKHAGLPEAVRTLPRIVAVLPLLTGRSVAGVVRESPLAPLETCAVISVLHRLRLLQFGEARAAADTPQELDQPFFPRALDPVYQCQHRLMASLLAYQRGLAHSETSYDPWARCAFTRVAAPMPDPRSAAAVVVLVDELETPGCVRVRGEAWESGEVLARVLDAHVFQVPAGAVEVTLVPYVGRAKSWPISCGRDQVTLVRLAKGWRGWTMEVVELVGLSVRHCSA